MIRIEVKRWLKMSRDDFDSAQVNFDNKKYYVCVFLCQQSVEKGLKAIVIRKTGELFKVHDLILLGKKLNAPEGILAECDKINGVYLDTRYGDIGGKVPSEKFDMNMAKTFLKSTNKVLKWLEKEI